MPEQAGPEAAVPGKAVPEGAPRGALHGIRVIEIAGLGPAPFCAMMLADHGAEVLRIARPETAGADLRTSPLDRGRDTLLIDLKSPAGISLLLELVVSADVLVEGFRPGVAERLGFGPAECLARNPRLVYGRMTGWGQEGPLARTAGHDIDYIARAGALHAIGRGGGPPQVPLNVVGDFGGGGMLMAFGVCAALLERQVSGAGQVIDAAIVDGVCSLLAMQFGFLANGYWVDRRGENVLDGGAPFYDVYETADAGWIAVGAVEDQFYARLLEILGLTDLPGREDRSCWPVIRERLAAAFASRTREEWTTLFAGTDACVAPVLSFTEAARDPQIIARATLAEHDGYIQPAPSPRFSRSSSPPLRPYAAPRPRLDEVLRSWGVHDADAAVAGGVVARPPAARLGTAGKPVSQ
jgi:alpha-methylacyl-CoA racemase